MYSIMTILKKKFNTKTLISGISQDFSNVSKTAPIDKEIAAKAEMTLTET